MKDRLLSIAYAALYWVGITAIFYAIRRQQVVLSYHNVIADEIWDGKLHLGVSHRLSEFEAQLKIICSRFTVGTDFSDHRTCLITFDDGNQNNVNAAAALEKRGVRGVFFVPVEAVLTGRLPVIEQVLMWFSYVPAGNFNLAGNPGHIDDASRSSAYAQFYQWLMRDAARWDQAVRLLDEAYAFTNLKVPTEMKRQRFTPLSPPQLEQMKERGHSIGCHSWRHMPLAILSDEEIQGDFRNCNQLSFNSPAYCYPFGGPAEVDERAIRACREAGFKHGLLNVSKSPYGESAFAATRNSLPQTTNRYVIEAKLSGLEAFLKRMTRQ